MEPERTRSPGASLEDRGDVADHGDWVGRSLLAVENAIVERHGGTVGPARNRVQRPEHDRSMEDVSRDDPGRVVRRPGDVDELQCDACARDGAGDRGVARSRSDVFAELEHHFGLGPQRARGVRGEGRAVGERRGPREIADDRPVAGERLGLGDRVPDLPSDPRRARRQLATPRVQEDTLRGEDLWVHVISFAPRARRRGPAPPGWPATRARRPARAACPSGCA